MNDKQVILRAQEAESKLEDPLIKAVFAGIKKEALEALAIVDPANTIEIVKLQQKIAVIDGFGDTLNGYVLHGQSVSSKDSAL